MQSRNGRRGGFAIWQTGSAACARRCASHADETGQISNERIAHCLLSIARSRKEGENARRAGVRGSLSVTALAWRAHTAGVICPAWRRRRTRVSSRLVSHADTQSRRCSKPPAELLCTLCMLCSASCIVSASLQPRLAVRGGARCGKAADNTRNWAKLVAFPPTQSKTAPSASSHPSARARRHRRTKNSRADTLHARNPKDPRRSGGMRPGHTHGSCVVELGLGRGLRAARAGYTRRPHAAARTAIEKQCALCGASQSREHRHTRHTEPLAVRQAHTAHSCRGRSWASSMVAARRAQSGPGKRDRDPRAAAAGLHLPYRSSQGIHPDTPLTGTPRRVRVRMRMQSVATNKRDSVAVGSWLGRRRRALQAAMLHAVMLSRERPLAPLGTCHCPLRRVEQRAASASLSEQFSTVTSGRGRVGHVMAGDIAGALGRLTGPEGAACAPPLEPRGGLWTAQKGRRHSGRGSGNWHRWSHGAMM